MCSTGIIVLFACKSCNASFQSIPDFIEHKRLNHSVEFQNTAVILFKETPIKPYDQAPHPEEDWLPPRVESKSTPNSEPTFTTTNHETLGEGNKPEDCKPKIYPCIDIDCHSDSEAEINLQKISATSTSEKYIDNSSSFTCEDKILHPPKLKQIGLNNSSNTECTGQCSQIQKTIINYNKNKNDNDISNLSVQPELAIATASQPFPNPHVLLRRLTSKEIQNYSSGVNTETQQDLLLSGNENYAIDLDQDDEPNDCSIFLRPKVEILEECDDVPLADYTCKFCQSNFVSYTALQLHLKTCVSLARTSHSYCSLCNLNFASSHDLQAHNLAQHGTEIDKNAGQFFQNGIRPRFCFRVQPYKCHLCGTCFVTGAPLSNHLITHTHSEEGRFACSYPRCGKGFKTVGTLDLHRATHCKGFLCKFSNCDSIFGSQESLKDHVQTHINKLLNVTKNR